jgi:hypothetical protein
VSTSGYTSCPCCGYDTVSSDTSKPEQCSDCDDAGCDEDNPLCCEPDEPSEPDGEDFRGGEAAAYQAEQMAGWQRDLK